MNTDDVIFLTAGCCLAASIAGFGIATLRKRPMTIGIGYSTASLLLYVSYFSDQIGHHVAQLGPVSEYARTILLPLALIGDPDLGFSSSDTLAILILGVYVLWTGLYVRLARNRRKLGRAADSISTFIAAATLLLVLGATLTPAYQLGPIGITVYAVIAAGAYFFWTAGVLGQVAELGKQIAAYVWEQLKRSLSKAVSAVTIAIAYLAALPHRLTPDLRAWAVQIEKATDAVRRKVGENNDRDDDKIETIDRRYRPHR
jgi:hypothetical protein